MNKISKIYICKKINDNLINGCNKYQQRIKQLVDKDFLNKLFE